MRGRPGWPRNRRQVTHGPVKPRAQTLALGNFDGVHLGHRKLLAAAKAQLLPEESLVAVTFDPHPAALVAPDKAPKLLTSIKRRQMLLLEAGADKVEVLAFDSALAATPYDVFATSILAEGLSARQIFVGEDFRFGVGRKGNVSLLAQVGQQAGFSVVPFAPVSYGGRVVSSTWIRELLEDGNVEEASTLLERPYDITAKVIQGDGRGRTIGVPTANLSPPQTVVPKNGVYAVRAKTREGGFSGVANIGVRPTVSAGFSIEVHLLDADLDLYGQEIRVAFVKRLRSEQKFDSLETLVAQIRADIAAARALFA